MTLQRAANRAVRSRAAKVAYLVGIVDGATLDRPELRSALLHLLAEGQGGCVRRVACALDVPESTLRRRYASLRQHLQALALGRHAGKVRRKPAQLRNG